MKYIRESSVEKTLVATVKKHGGICKKWVCPGHRGAPDRIVIFGGKVFFVETKAPKGVVKPWQKRFHEMLKSYHVEVVVLKTAEDAKLWVELQFSLVIEEKKRAVLEYMHSKRTPRTTAQIVNISSPTRY